MSSIRARQVEIQFNSINLLIVTQHKADVVKSYQQSIKLNLGIRSRVVMMTLKCMS